MSNAPKKSCTCAVANESRVRAVIVSSRDTQSYCSVPATMSSVLASPAASFSDWVQQMLLFDSGVATASLCPVRGAAASTDLDRFERAHPGRAGAGWLAAAPAP